jgi:class 3 adenylate cyclase
MEQPQIQFARTSDGVSIAYATMGEGPPLLYCAALPSVSMQSRLSDPSSPAPLLAANTRVTDFDHAGMGASQRDVADFSLDAQVRTIEAVAARLSDDPLTIVGNTSGSASAALYAIRHPGRVRALACVNPGFAPMEHMADEMRENWSFARRRFAGFTFPDGPVAAQRWYSTALRESMRAEVAAAYVEENARADLREIFRAIPVPTLLCVPRAGPGSEASLALASLVPDCRVVVESGGADRAAAAAAAKAAILEFMGIQPTRVAARSDEEASMPSAFRTVLFTDIVGHTEMMARLGDVRGRDVLREHERITRETLKAHGGAEVKTMGDGFMASFGSVTSAMECAIALQRAFAAHTDSMSEPLHVRVGLNAGEPIEEDGDLFGATVILASRIAAKAGAGEIFVPDTVRGLLSGKGFVFGDRGEFVPKGFDEGVRLWEVVWRE